MKIDVARRAADDVAAGQRGNLVVVAHVGQNRVLRLRVLLHIRSDRKLVLPIEAVAGDAFARDRQDRRNRAEHEEHAGERAPPGQPPQPAVQVDEVRGRHGAEQEIRGVKQLVVVVRIRLEHDEFTDEPDHDRRRGDRKAAPRRGKQRGQDEQRGGAEIDEVEPDIAVRQIAPVEPAAHEGLRARLREGPRQKLRHGEHQDDREKDTPGAEDRAAEPAAKRADEQRRQRAEEQEGRRGDRHEKQRGIPRDHRRHEELDQNGQNDQHGGRALCRAQHFAGILREHRAAERKAEPDAADQPEREERMRVDHDHGPGKNAGRHKIGRAALVDRAVQHVEQREQQRPAEKRRALREHHVDDHIDPAHVLVDEVGRRLIESRENAREVPAVLPEARQEIGEAEAAVQKKQHHRQDRLGLIAQKAAEKEPRAEKDLRRRKQHRQKIREL